METAPTAPAARPATELGLDDLIAFFGSQAAAAAAIGMHPTTFRMHIQRGSGKVADDLRKLRAAYKRQMAKRQIADQPAPAPEPVFAPRDERPHGLMPEDAPVAPEPVASDSGILPERLKQLGKLLSLTEAREYRPLLIAALTTVWGLTDQGITATTADGTEAVIWRTIDGEDTAVIVDFLLDQARKSEAAAVAVRVISDAWERYRVGLILGTRMVQTAQHYVLHGIGMPVGATGQRGAA